MIYFKRHSRMSKIIDLTVKLYVKISTYNKIQEI